MGADAMLLPKQQFRNQLLLALGLHQPLRRRLGATGLKAGDGYRIDQFRWEVRPTFSRTVTHRRLTLSPGRPVCLALARSVPLPARGGISSGISIDWSPRASMAKNRSVFARTLPLVSSKVNVTV